MIKLVSGCAAAMLVLGGCATSIDTANNQALDTASGSEASSYIVDIDNNPLMSGGGGCLRSIHWNGDVGEACGGTVAAAVEPVEPEPIVEVPLSIPPADAAGSRAGLDAQAGVRVPEDHFTKPFYTI